jgi:hypothetical protein
VPIFEKPPLETLTPAKDRWTPIYLEHGRLEVDDSSIKWIGADGMVCRIETTGPTNRKSVEVTGLWIIAEKWEDVTTVAKEETVISPESPS